MITQEEIPFTQEEYKAMVKTIGQLRREKRELFDRFSHWLFKNITHRVSNGIGNGLIINFDSYSDMIEDLRKAMEE